jgi:hypothetical protein
MHFDEFDRGVIILGNANDSHIGVGRQCPGNAISHQQAILGNEDRNWTTHLNAILPRSFAITRSLNHDRYSTPSVLTIETIRVSSPAH